MLRVEEGVERTLVEASACWTKRQRKKFVRVLRAGDLSMQSAAAKQQ
jgi:hypothetical protein